MKWIKNITKDTLSTFIGFVASAAVSGGTAYLQGGMTKEAAIAGAVVGAAGYLHNKGNKDKAFKEN